MCDGRRGSIKNISKENTTLLEGSIKNISKKNTTLKEENVKHLKLKNDMLLRARGMNFRDLKLNLFNSRIR